jgi:Ras-related protein Rab-1A
MSNNQEYDYLFKLILIGNSSVGKSSLLVRFVEDIWEENFVPTIGVDFKLKTLDVDGKKVKLQIWDTAGQERFKNITASYYRGGNGVLVVYDITDRESFVNLNSWLIEIEKNANKNVFKLLIGNKNDLESERKVTFDEGKEFADSNGMKFIETSAKTANKVNEAFELLTKEIIKSSLNKDKVIVNKGNERKIELNKGTDLTKKKESGCCIIF